MTVLFALLALNVIQTVLLQLKILYFHAILHKSYTLIKVSENENFSVLINTQTERSGQSKN